MAAGLLTVKTAAAFVTIDLQAALVGVDCLGNNSGVQAMEMPMAKTKSGIENSREYFITLPLYNRFGSYSYHSANGKSEKNPQEDGYVTNEALF